MNLGDPSPYKNPNKLEILIRADYEVNIALKPIGSGVQEVELPTIYGYGHALSLSGLTIKIINHLRFAFLFILGPFLFLTHAPRGRAVLVLGERSKCAK